MPISVQEPQKFTVENNLHTSVMYFRILFLIFVGHSESLVWDGWPYKLYTCMYV